MSAHKYHAYLASMSHTAFFFAQSMRYFVWLRDRSKTWRSEQQVTCHLLFTSAVLGRNSTLVSMISSEKVWALSGHHDTRIYICQIFVSRGTKKRNFISLFMPSICFFLHSLSIVTKHCHRLNTVQLKCCISKIPCTRNWEVTVKLSLCSYEYD